MKTTTELPPTNRPRSRASTRWRTLAAFVSLSMVVAAPVGAQTPISSVGLGVPVPSIDARAAALGGTGLGLRDGSLSARNPADIALFGRPALGITYAPEGASVEGDDGSLDTGRSRMAVLRGAVPFEGWAVGVAFASELDQDWQVEFSDTLAATDGEYPFTEQRSQDGGISSVNLTAARDLGSLAVGVEYAILTGRTQLRYRREFEPALDDPSSVLNPSTGRATWQYGGSRVRVGASLPLGDRVQVGADVSLSGELTAERDTVAGPAGTRRYDMPAAMEAGGSARVSDRLLLAGAGGWTGWAGAEGGSDEYVASNVTWFGVGAELTGTRLLGASVPLRLGIRRTGLPFHAPGTEQPSETAVTLGLGVRVAEEKARLDFALELGSRGDLAGSGVEEGFRRLSLSLAIFQD
ncbi:MAG: hypothetical protein ACODAA_05410 [Gemmatimonadota bacterium]